MGLKCLPRPLSTEMLGDGRGVFQGLSSEARAGAGALETNPWSGIAVTPGGFQEKPKVKRVGTSRRGKQFNPESRWFLHPPVVPSAEGRGSWGKPER